MANDEARGVQRTTPDRWSAREGIAGEWSTSPTLWLLAFPFIVLIQQTRLQLVSTWVIPQLLAISFLGQVAALLVLLAARRIWVRVPEVGPRSLVAVIVIWLIAGGVAGAITGWLVGLFQIVQVPGQVLLAMLSMAMTTVLTYLLVSFTMGVVRGHRVEVGRLRDYRDVLVLRSQESGAHIEDQQRLLRKALDDSVLPAFRELVERVEALSSRPLQEELVQLRRHVITTSQTLVGRLEDGIDDAVQQRRTNRLRRIAQGRRTDGGWRSIILNASVTPRIGCLIVIAFAFVERLRGCVTTSIVMAVGMVIVVLAGATVRRYTSAEPPGTRLAVGVGTIVAILLVFWAVTRLEIAGCSWSGSTEALVTSGCTLVGALAFAGVSLEADRQLRLMKDELRDANDASHAAIAVLNETGRALRDQVSHVLNGVLQGRLAAVSIALQAHIDDLGRGGHPSTERLVEQVTALLRLADQDTAEMATEPGHPLRLDEALHQLRSRWVGLLTVGWDIEPAAQVLLDDDSILLQWANEVIDHAVTNSSRHGGATGLTIEVSTSGVVVGWLRIRIRDNGFGPGPDEVLGGSGARSVISRQGTWVLCGRSVGGAELTVDLPGTRWSSDNYA